MKVLIHDVHASESGALAILDDFYNQVKLHNDKAIKWVFIVSTPKFENTENIEVLRYPWVKRSWFHRLFFDLITTRLIIIKHKPNKIFSLQNKGVMFNSTKQMVYLHLPFILCNYKFTIRYDGAKLWFYQNILKWIIFLSLKRVESIIVQTNWMKTELIQQANIDEGKILVATPQIPNNNFGKYVKYNTTKHSFFYPATGFKYKNHQIILNAFVELSKDHNLNYELLFTLTGTENKYTKSLMEYSKAKNLNVKFIGLIPRTEVFDLYTKSTLIFPSFVESFGMPLLEARYCNTPIIASDLPFSNEILDTYQNKYFFDPTNSFELANCIKSSINSPTIINNQIIELQQVNLVEQCIKF